MEQFHFIVLTIAAVFLILIFVFVGYLISQKNTKAEFPPIGMNDNKCPNYWTVVDDDTCKTNGTKNVGDLSNNYFKDQKTHPFFGASGQLNSGEDKFISYDDKTTTWTLNKKQLGLIDKGKSDGCNAKKWANFNDIVWDGVSSKTNC